jgi:hypothetical protein
VHDSRLPEETFRPLFEALSWAFSMRRALSALGRGTTGIMAPIVYTKASILQANSTSVPAP